MTGIAQTHLYYNYEKYPLSPLKPRGLVLLSWHVPYNWGSDDLTDDLLWRHRHMSQPLAIVTSQWPIVPTGIYGRMMLRSARVKVIAINCDFIFVFGSPCFNTGITSFYNIINRQLDSIIQNPSLGHANLKITYPKRYNSIAYNRSNMSYALALFRTACSQKSNNSLIPKHISINILE